MKIIFDYPPKELSPNARVHRAVLAKKKSSYKNDCHIIAKMNLPLIEHYEIPLKITFHPRTAHKVDKDNCIAAFKAGQDGIANAWGVDDSRFDPQYDIGEPVKGGRVVVEV